jgi:Flp pilus assembly protein TadB
MTNAVVEVEREIEKTTEEVEQLRERLKKAEVDLQDLKLSHERLQAKRAGLQNSLPMPITSPVCPFQLCFLFFLFLFLFFLILLPLLLLFFFFLILLPLLLSLTLSLLRSSLSKPKGWLLEYLRQ